MPIVGSSTKKIKLDSYIYKKGTVIDNFNDINIYNELYQSTISQIITKFGKGIKITGTVAGDYAYARRAYNEVVNDIIGGHFYIDDVNVIDAVYLEVEQGVHRFAIKLLGSTQLKRGWNTLVAKREDLTKEGGLEINWANPIDKIKLKALGAAGQIPEMVVSELFVDQYAYPKVMLTFDGGYGGIYDNALPLLDSNGIKATNYIATNHIDVPTYMTLAQVQALKAAGWTLGLRSYSTQDYGLLSYADRAAELMSAIGYMYDNGLGLPTHYAYPMPWTNLESQISENTTLLNELGFKTARNIYSTKQVAPIDYMYSLCSLPTSIGATSIKNYINKAYNAKTNLILYCHDVVVGASGVHTEYDDFVEIVNHIISKSGLQCMTMEDFYTNL